ILFPLQAVKLLLSCLPPSLTSDEDAMVHRGMEKRAAKRCQTENSGEHLADVSSPCSSGSRLPLSPRCTQYCVSDEMFPLLSLSAIISSRGLLCSCKLFTTKKARNILTWQINNAPSCLSTRAGGFTISILSRPLHLLPESSLLCVPRHNTG